MGVMINSAAKMAAITVVTSGKMTSTRKWKIDNVAVGKRNVIFKLYLLLYL